MKQFLQLFILLLAVPVFSQADHSESVSYPPMKSQGHFLGSIKALRDVPPNTNYVHGIPGDTREKENFFTDNARNNPHPQPENGDPLAKNLIAANRSGQQIIPGLNFEGLHDPSGVAPPDPTGDVGKDHYMQMVNTSSGAWFQIWDKNTGQSVYGPALSSTFWGQLGLSSLGDPIVQYDQNAERWLVIEIEGDGNNPFANSQLLLAVSDGSDPTGGWKSYVFQTLGFPDYPKFYVWNNAYFITVNELLNGNKCAGYALNRASILAGEPTFDLYRFEMPNYAGISFQPATGADWEGGAPPPANSPEYIFRVYDDAWEGGQDQLQYWSVYVNWSNQSMSHIDGPVKLYPTPFETRVCFGAQFSWDCVEQPGTNTRIAVMEKTILYRVPYRNFGSHESVVLNHVSDVSGQVGDGGDAEIRWYELQKSGSGDWGIAQEGTYAPDVVTNRFMGMLSLDEAGNIGMGYSGASTSMYPSLFLTGRRADDSPGTMTLDEYTVATGTASHTTNRWGDYCNVSVDPYDGRTFWFTGEYQPDANDIWGTRICSFKVQRDTYDVKPELLVKPVASPTLGNNEQVTVRISNNGLKPGANVSVSMYFEGAFVTTENLATQVDVNGSVDHTFSATVAMPTPGKNYKFRFITHWAQDQFLRNDTLDAVVQKLTSNDASLIGKFNLPPLVCGTEQDFGIILKNAAAVPLTSVDINWRINTQNWNLYHWTGNLAPGERDTIPFHATGILNGLNGLKANTSLPNGIQDERINNDSLFTKFYGNVTGTYLSIESESKLGTLHWELRSQTNVLITAGEVSAQQPVTQMCASDNTCYKVLLRAGSFNWKGHFVLRDIFGKILVEIFDAGPTDQTFTVCTPPRQQVDVGPLSLVAPKSGNQLQASEPVTVQFRNFGLTQQSNVSVGYRLDNGAWKTETIPGPIAPSQTVDHTFSGTEDLSTPGGVYHFSMMASVNGDQIPGNDTLSTTVYHRHIKDLELLGLDQGNACADTSFAFIYLKVRNNGLNDQHTFDISYTLNGVVQPVVPGNILNAASDKSDEVVLFVPGLQIGQNDLEVSIQNVDDDGADEVPANDTQSISFTVDPANAYLDLVFTPDNKPQETTWEIVDQQGNVVKSGGPYTDPSALIIDDACLIADACYIFRLHDSGGDGMSGGLVTLTYQNQTLIDYSGANFGSQLDLPFCATLSCAGFSASADVTPATGPGIADGVITITPAGGNPPYHFILNDTLTQSAPVFSHLAPGSYHIACIDASGCASELNITIGTVATQEPVKFRRLTATPNPTENVSHIEIQAWGKEFSAVCDVFDQHGKLLESMPMSRWDDTLRGNILLDEFPDGVYYLRITGLDRIYVGRILKK